MRRKFMIGISVCMLATLTACGSAEQPSDVGVGTGSSSSTPTAERSQQPSASLVVPDALAKKARPCSVVTTDMLNRALAVDYPGSSFRVMSVDGVDVNNPPAVGSYLERNCVYTGTVAGVFSDNPNDPPYSFDLMVTTFVDDEKGTNWAAMKSVGGSSIVGVGQEALLTDVEMVAREGRSIAKVWSVTDTEEVLDESVMSAILQPAMAGVAG